MTNSFSVKVRAFCKLVFKEHVPVSVARIGVDKDDVSEMEKKVLHLRFYDDHKDILEAISTLYLKRNVIFDKWY